MVLPDLNFTPPEDDVHIPEGEHAGTLSTAKKVIVSVKLSTPIVV